MPSNEQTLAMATALLNASMQLATNQSNQEMNDSTNQTNLDITNATNSNNMLLNEENRRFQAEQNQITRDREDNAVRRRANDLIGAGLSKTLAAGEGASANVMQAPQNTFGYQVGHAMKAFRADSPYMDNRVAETMLQKKRLEIENDALDIQRDNLAEVRRHNEKVENEDKRHNESVERENDRYHTLMDFWERAKLSEESRYHDDAIRVSEAEVQIKRDTADSDIKYKEFQNAYLGAQTELVKQTKEENAVRLTADLAESAARIASYAADVRLSSAQISYIRKNMQYVTQQIATEIASRKILNVQAQFTLARTLSELYNLGIALSEGTTTSGTVVSESVADQNSKSRKNDIAGRLVSGATGFLSVGAGAFLGAGGGMFIKKMLGMDDHTDYSKWL